MVFEATVRTCREGCQPAYCPGPAGRSEPSFGRRRRSINGTVFAEGSLNVTSQEFNITSNDIKLNTTITNDEQEVNSNDFPEHVREMIEVFESREEIEHESVARKIVAPQETVCLSPSEYHGLISAVVLLMILLLSITLVAGLAYR